MQRSRRQCLAASFHYRDLPPSTANPSPMLLLTYDAIPPWHQDNEYIKSGYRPESRAASKSFASLKIIHNETVNIYSHLVPAAIFMALGFVLVKYFQTQYPESATSDILIFGIFLLSAVVCLGLSSIYHTLMNHSKKVSHLWLRIDYFGIVILTLGDFVSGIYMVFYCEPTLRVIYWTMIIALGTATGIILLHPTFQGPKWRTLRIGTFVGTGLSGFVPLIHGTAIFGFAQMIRQSGMLYYLVEGLLLILGAFFYATRIPESIRPGKFDIWGSSHQIFHVLVVLATVVQLYGISEAFNYNYRHRKCT